MFAFMRGKGGGGGLSGNHHLHVPLLKYMYQLVWVGNGQWPNMKLKKVSLRDTCVYSKSQPNFEVWIMTDDNKE